MPRRDVSKRDKIRVEEKEVDKQLKDAGFEDMGLSFEEKKNILAMLEESRKSAEVEKNQREQLRLQEEEILHDALSESFQSSDVKEKNLVDEPSNKEEPVAVVEVDAPVANQDCEADNNSDSGSATPDLIDTPIQSPVKPNLTSQFLSPVRSSSSALTLAQQSPRQSDDFILFSQSSAKLGVDQNVIENCIKTISVSDSEDELDEEMLCSPCKSVPSPKIPPRSPLIKSRTPVKQLQSSSTPSVSPRLSPFARLSAIEPRRSIRKYQSESDVPTPVAVNHKEDDSEVKSSSQPSSFALKHRQVSKLSSSKFDESLVSPVIGRSKLTAIAKLSLTESKSSSMIGDENLQSPKTTGSSPEIIADDEISSSDVVSSSVSPTVTEKRKENCTPLKSSPSKNEISQNAERTIIEATPEDMDCSNKSRERSSPLLDKVTMRRGLNCDRKPFFQGLNLSDSEGEGKSPVKGKEMKMTPKKNGEMQRNEFLTEGKDLCLKRKYKKIPNSNEFYLRNDNESATAAYERIMNLINQYFSTLKEYQSTLPNKLPWGDPIKVDKRVKDSLDAPRVFRRQVEVPRKTDDTENARVTRNAQLRNQAKAGDDVYSSEESLPDPDSVNGSVYDIQRRTTNKRRGVQLSSSRKHAKFHHNEESDSKVNKELAVINESDSDDFELPPLASRLIRSPQAFRENTVTTPVRSPGNKINDNRKYISTVDEVATNFDLGNILASSQGSENITEVEEEGEAASLVKKDLGSLPVVPKVDIDCQPSTSGYRSSRLTRNKQPRKTFMLSLDSDEGSQNKETSCSSSSNPDVSLKTRSSPMAKRDIIQEDIAMEKDSEDVSFMLKSKSSLSVHKESLVFQNSFADEITVNEPSRKVNDGSTSTPRDAASAATVSPVVNVRKKDKSKLMQIKPAPLRLKNNPGKRRGRKAALERDQIEDNDTHEESPPVSEIAENTEEGAESIEEVECPLCMERFPKNVIEAHASNCGESPEDIAPQPLKSNGRGNRKLFNARGNHGTSKDSPEIIESDEDVRVPDSDVRRRMRARTPPECIRCVHCNKYMKEGSEYLAHVMECQAKESSRAFSHESSPGMERRNPHSERMSPNHGRISRNLAASSSSVFDRLEESERTKVPYRSSPIRNFVPISQQVDSLIDYRNQFHRQPARQRSKSASAPKKTKRKGGRKRKPKANAKKENKKPKLK